MTWHNRPWTGVYPATLCPFHADESIDEEGLHQYIADVSAVDGVRGVVCNGHTGEIMSLRPRERAQVTRIVATAAHSVGRDVKVVSGVSAEGSLEAIDHALAAGEAGADAVLLMPPHHWLRFGRSTCTAVGYFEDVAAGADMPIIVHQYPAWTKAGYTLAEMLELVKLPQVVMIKMGTRDMARWLYDYEQLKAAAPHVSIVTCHDEYLLPTLLEAADGALVGFAGFVPELIVQMVHAALEGDLAGAREAQQLVAPLARIVYGFGEPSSDAHQRMKCARWLMGKFPSPHMRRPLRPLPVDKIAKIRAALAEIGYAERARIDRIAMSTTVPVVSGSSSPREVREACRDGRFDGPTRGLALGYVQCNLVILRERHAYDFLLYCQRNARACPVLEVTDVGSPEPRQMAAGADLRTDLPRYAVYRHGVRMSDVFDIRDLWQADFVAFLIGSGITFDEALQRAGVPTDRNRWLLRTTISTVPAGVFRGPLVVTMRWLTAEQANVATQVTSRFPFNHGAPIHVGDPQAIGADLANPYFGPPIKSIPPDVTPVFWACGVTPQEAALAAKIDVMIAHAPVHSFVTDWEASRLQIE